MWHVDINNEADVKVNLSIINSIYFLQCNGSSNKSSNYAKLRVKTENGQEILNFLSCFFFEQIQK